MHNLSVKFEFPEKYAFDFKQALSGWWYDHMRRYGRFELREIWPATGNEVRVGLSETQVSDFLNYLDARGWYYEVVKEHVYSLTH